MYHWTLIYLGYFCRMDAILTKMLPFHMYHWKSFPCYPHLHLPYTRQKGYKCVKSGVGFSNQSVGWSADMSCDFLTKEAICLLFTNLLSINFLCKVTDGNKLCWAKKAFCLFSHSTSCLICSQSLWAENNKSLLRRWKGATTKWEKYPWTVWTCIEIGRHIQN